jgi:hypothetical protein
MENVKLPDPIYLVGARYSKSRLQSLRALGFGPDETALRRCSHCACKVLIHSNSLKEWNGIGDAITLICGDCANTVEATQSVTKAITPAAFEIYQRAMNKLSSN